jgi:hypothetical protein
VNVLEVLPPAERAFGDLPTDRSEAPDERRPFVRREETGVDQHLNVRDAAGKVVADERAVDRERAQKAGRGRTNVRRRSEGVRHGHGGPEPYPERGAGGGAFDGAERAPTAAHVRAGSPQT